MKCLKCGGKVKIKIMKVNNEFTGIEVRCVKCGKDYSDEIEYDNERAGDLD